MNKKIILISILFLVLACLGVGAYLFFPKPHSITGTVTRTGEMYGNTEWGITYRRLPFLPKHSVTISMLDTALQKEGLVVTCPYIIRDVIGTSEWDVILDGAGCVESSSFVSSSGEFRTYANHMLGFTMKIPKRVYPVVCPNPELELLGLKELLVIEGVDSVSFGVECEKGKIVLLSTWHIRVTSFVSSFEQAGELFKELYGSSCEINLSSTRDERGNYDITHIPDDKDIEQSNCFIGRRFAFKYNPQLQKVAQWNMGQEANFWKDNGEYWYDGEVAESFRFIGTYGE